MTNYELNADEVVLYEGMLISREYMAHLYATLTSQKIIIEKEKGFFKREREVVDVVLLENIKLYNNVPQIKQKGFDVGIQAIDKNFTLSFPSMIEAKKFTGKIVDAVTGTTLAKRSSDKIKGAFDMVDETLGLDTRGDN